MEDKTGDLRVPHDNNSGEEAVKAPDNGNPNKPNEHEGDQNSTALNVEGQVGEHDSNECAVVAPENLPPQHQNTMDLEYQEHLEQYHSQEMVAESTEAVAALALEETNLLEIETKTGEFQSSEVSEATVEEKSERPQDSPSCIDETKSDVETKSSVIVGKKGLQNYIHVETKGRNENSQFTIATPPASTESASIGRKNSSDCTELTDCNSQRDQTDGEESPLLDSKKQDKNPVGRDDENLREQGQSIDTLKGETFQEGIETRTSTNYSAKFQNSVGKLEAQDEAPVKKLHATKRTPNYPKRFRGGIEWSNNSCYFDSTIFAMFHQDDHLDSSFLHLSRYEDSKDEDVRIIKGMLNTIVGSMRYGLCPSSNVEKLRKYLTKFNPRLVRIMLDVEEMLMTLCKFGLKLPPFIKYTFGSTNFYHQIFFQNDYKEMRTVQELLESSMKFQRLIFESIPHPVLFLKMPRNNGVLQHCRYILPNLTIDLSGVVKEGRLNNSMVLRAVICLQSLHYTVYVRNLKTKQWCYFNDLGPTIIELDNFEEEIAGGSFYGSDGNLTNLMTGAHFCLYLPPVNEFKIKSNQCD